MCGMKVATSIFYLQSVIREYCCQRCHVFTVSYSSEIFPPGQIEPIKRTGHGSVLQTEAPGTSQGVVHFAPAHTRDGGGHRAPSDPCTPSTAGQREKASCEKTWTQSSNLPPAPSSTITGQRGSFFSTVRKTCKLLLLSCLQMKILYFV